MLSVHLASISRRHAGFLLLKAVSFHYAFASSLVYLCGLCLPGISSDNRNSLCFGDPYCMELASGWTIRTPHSSGQCVLFRQGYVALVKLVRANPRVFLELWGKRHSFPWVYQASSTTHIRRGSSVTRWKCLWENEDTTKVNKVKRQRKGFMKRLFGYITPRIFFSKKRQLRLGFHPLQLGILSNKLPLLTQPQDPFVAAPLNQVRDCNTTKPFRTLHIDLAMPSFGPMNLTSQGSCTCMPIILMCVPAHVPRWLWALGVTSSPPGPLHPVQCLPNGRYIRSDVTNV